jgi:hypothetical protein
MLMSIIALLITFGIGLALGWLIFNNSADSV